jgi:hypothetical protein
LPAGRSVFRFAAATPPTELGFDEKPAAGHFVTDQGELDGLPFCIGDVDEDYATRLASEMTDVNTAGGFTALGVVAKTLPKHTQNFFGAATFAAPLFHEAQQIEIFIGNAKLKVTVRRGKLSVKYNKFERGYAASPHQDVWQKNTDTCKIFRRLHKPFPKGGWIVWQDCRDGKGDVWYAIYMARETSLYFFPDGARCSHRAAHYLVPTQRHTTLKHALPRRQFTSVIDFAQMDMCKPKVDSVQSYMDRLGADFKTSTLIEEIEAALAKVDSDG